MWKAVYRPLLVSCLVASRYVYGGAEKDLSVLQYSGQRASRMAILTFDGQTPNQKIVIGRTYRVKLHVPRTYNIQAVSKPE